VGGGKGKKRKAGMRPVGPKNMIPKSGVLGGQVTTRLTGGGKGGGEEKGGSDRNRQSLKETKLPGYDPRCLDSGKEKWKQQTSGQGGQAIPFATKGKVQIGQKKLAGKRGSK